MSADKKPNFIIDERDDTMLIAERNWQFGWSCIATRPRLLTNDEWRPTAERIVAALEATEQRSHDRSGGK